MSKVKKLKLENGEVVELSFGKDSVLLKGRTGEWVSFNPSLKTTGVSDVDSAHVLVSDFVEVDRNNA